MAGSFSYLFSHTPTAWKVNEQQKGHIFEPYIGLKDSLSLKIEILDHSQSLLQMWKDAEVSGRKVEDLLTPKFLS